MTFAPGESKTLHVAYVMPMYLLAARSFKSLDEMVKISKDKPWLMKLANEIGEGLLYVTETGNSWAGPIEDAEFEIRLSGFEQYLNNRPLDESNTDNDKKSDDNAAESKKNAKTPRLTKDIYLHREIHPNGWKEKDGVIHWHYKNFRPKDDIDVAYYLMFLPKNPDDLPTFTDYIFDGKGTKEDWSELREVFLALWGIEPKSKTIREFAPKQMWYSPKKDMTAEKLSADQKAFLAEFDRLAKNVK
jgi:hypothetical protein